MSIFLHNQMSNFCIGGFKKFKFCSRVFVLNSRFIIHLFFHNILIRYYAVTQFEPTFARSAFPCFDEPKFKSTFDISIGRREDMVSLSNTDKKSQEPM